MRRIILAIAALLCISPIASASILQLDVPDTLDASQTHTCTIDSRSIDSATLYGVWTASGAVGMKVAVWHGVNGGSGQSKLLWARMGNAAAAADSVLLVTASSGTRLNVVHPLWREIDSGGGFSRTAVNLTYPKLKFVFTNTGAVDMTAVKWFLAYQPVQ